MASKDLPPITREFTIHLHKRLYHVQFKKRAPTAIKAIHKFAQKQMQTRFVKIDVKVNHAVWSKGINHVPRRIRVRMQRKRNEDEDAKDKFYTIVTYVPCTDFHFLNHETVKEQ